MIASEHRARVDDRGRVHSDAARWCIDWSIGADDRWRRPGAEAGVRQQLVDRTPVVETAMRVPGGDAVQRAYGARDGKLGDVVVIEFENRSAVPFAVAVGIGAGPGPVRSIDMAPGGYSIVADGRVAVVLSHRPRLFTTATGDDDALGRAADGAAVDRFAGPVRCRQGRAGAGFVFPLAHTASLRVAIPLGSPRPGATGRLEPAELPDAAAVSRSWRSHRARGMRLVLPPGLLAEGAEAARCFLLLAHRGPAPLPGPIVDALAQYGYGREAAEAQRRLRRGRARARPRPGPEEDVVAGLSRLVERASPTWTWPGDTYRAAADFCRLIRAALVQDTAGRVELCPALPDAWMGQGIEVEDAPTSAGPLSFALRWHGRRPALLWEQSGSAQLSAPGLDTAWSTAAPRGESLLGPVAAGRTDE